MTEISKAEEIKKIILTLLEQMGFNNATVAYEDSATKGLIFNLDVGAEAYLLIGRQGTSLHALQVIAGQMSERLLKEPVWFVLDVDDYKMKREWFLKETAKAAVEHIKKTGRAVSLEPMPAFERRFVHAYIQENFPEAESMSMDVEPYRKIVVRLKKSA
jgi:spoIIIJ-associated protein